MTKEACIYNENTNEILTYGDYEKVHNTYINEINLLEMNHLSHNHLHFIDFKSFLDGYVNDENLRIEYGEKIVDYNQFNPDLFKKVFDKINENKILGIEPSVKSFDITTMLINETIDNLAVRSGYYFGFIKKTLILSHDINLKRSTQKVRIYENEYYLFEGKTWNDVQKIDELLDYTENYKIEDYTIKEAE